MKLREAVVNGSVGALIVAALAMPGAIYVNSRRPVVTPTEYVTVTETVTVPGPAVTVTKTESHQHVTVPVTERVTERVTETERAVSADPDLARHRRRMEYEACMRRHPLPDVFTGEPMNNDPQCRHLLEPGD